MAARRLIYDDLSQAVKRVLRFSERDLTDRLGRLYRRFQKVPLLIVDELGFVPFKREMALSYSRTL